MASDGAGAQIFPPMNQQFMREQRPEHLTLRMSDATLGAETAMERDESIEELEAARFDYAEAARLAGVRRYIVVNWARRGVLRLDYPLRLHRPALTVHDVFRLSVGARLVGLGLSPEGAFVHILAYGPRDVFECARQKATGTIYWVDGQGEVNQTVYYGSGGETLAEIAARYPAVVIPEKTLAQGLIQRVIEYLATAERPKVQEAKE